MREQTHAEHASVDRLFSRFDLTQPASYRAMLTAQAAAHCAIESALDQGGAAVLLADWAERRRADLVRADLAELGASLPTAITAPRLDGDARLLGGLYVIEGSRLGGAMLARQVAPGLPRRFLAAQAGAGWWRRLQDLLDRHLASPAAFEAAADAARACFKCFEQAGRLELEPIVA